MRGNLEGAPAAAAPWLVGSWLVLALTLSLPGCGKEQQRPRNVLLVSLDTVRADRVGAYGHAGANTPTLDGLAAAGAVFLEVSASTPLTLPSHATLLTGLDSLHHGVRHDGLFALSDSVVTLAEHSSQAGLRSAGFVGSVVLARRHGLAQGFEHYSEPVPRDRSDIFGVGERTAGEVNADALAWLDTLYDDPFLLFVHYMEAHAPYTPPGSVQMGTDDPYQAEITAADRALGELLAALEQRGKLADTLIIVVSDHGESLGEHGEQMHGIFLYQSTLHVPMIAVGPGVRAGERIAEPVGLVDVLPTLLDALALGPVQGLDGQSLWPALWGAAELDPNRVLYAESYLPRLDYGWSPLRTIRRGHEKYIEAPRPELYALESDPREMNDLAQAEGERAAELAGLLAQRVAASSGASAAAERIAPDDEAAPPIRSPIAFSGLYEGAGSSDLADPKDKIELVYALEKASEMIDAGDEERAERVLRRMLKTDPAFFEARIRLISLLLGRGEGERAAQQATMLIESARDLPHAGRVAARGHVLIGQVHFEAGRFAEAAAEYERALEAPQPPELYEVLAAIYVELRRPADAHRVLTAALARGDASEGVREMLATLDALDVSAAP